MHTEVTNPSITRDDIDTIVLWTAVGCGFFGGLAGICYASYYDKQWSPMLVVVCIGLCALWWLSMRQWVRKPPSKSPERPDSGYGAFTPAQAAEIHAESLAFAAVHPTRARVQQGIAMIIGGAFFLAVPALLIWAWTGH